MRAPPLASLCLSLSLSLVAASETATNPPAPSSFTCVSGGGDRGGSCFVASCAQLHAAVDAGVSHITLYRNLTAADDARCAFPLRVSRPLTVRGACGDGTSKCSVSGGGVLVRQDRSACRQRCTRCENGEGPLFDVRDGGRLTLANLELRGACNARDGAGGAVVVRSNYRKKVEKGDGDVCSRASIESTPSAWAEADEAAAAVRDLKDERTAAAGLFHETEFDDENVDDDENVFENVFENASASLVAVGVAFVENLAVGGGGDAGNTNTDGRYGRSSSPPNGRGGAVAVFGASASATFLECAFEGNEAWGSASAGAIDAYAADVGEGGAVFLRRGVARVFRSAFTRNVAEKEGGAVYADRGARVSLEASTFSGNVVADDYWDGGGAVFLGDRGTSARADVARFVGNQVAVYPDARRKALTCGGGAVSVVRGAEAVFKYALFERNAAPRGGAVCAHDAAARFASPGRSGDGDGDGDASASSAVFRENESAHDWFGKPGGKDVECVQCFFGDAITEKGDASMPESASPALSLSKCAFVTDDAARKNGACAPPPSAERRAPFETAPQIVDLGTETSTAGLTVPGSPGSGRSGLGVAERSGVGVRGAAPPNALESAFAAALLGESNGAGDGVAFVVAAGSSAAADAGSSARREAPTRRAEGSF
jgi:hypothetical protein